ncbi:electron transport complex subunit RsxE [Prevotella sp.]|uniref:electron transport complex subunit RsxE n=2 Tax=Prevotella sp. TaxID=59823 RepID=UPI003AF47CC5
MKKLESSLKNMVIVLTAITVIATGLLAYVNQLTAGPIAEANAKALSDAIAVVVPGFDNNPAEAPETIELDGATYKIYKATKGGEFIGAAVESSAINGMGMGLATAFVLICSNVVISAIKNLIPDMVRIPAFVVVIASFVTLFQMIMQAYVPALYATLGLFIPLIVVNCILLGRAEAFAAKNGPVPSFFDGLGMGLGFTLALTILGGVREFLGTGKFNNNTLMAEAIKASETEMVTVAMKRIELNDEHDDLLSHIIQNPNIQLLPNTSGVRNAEEAVFAAQMAREAFGTNWLKLEIHPDPRYLLPDSIETLKATEQLVKMGFVVLPYCQADPTLCKHLEEAGAATVMPLAAPIGTNKGLRMKDFLQIIIEQATVPVVVDAGIGAPSHAAEAMEMGASACLVNTAIAVAGNPVEMAKAFKEAVVCGRRAYEAGLGAVSDCAEASSPLTQFLM